MEHVHELAAAVDRIAKDIGQVEGAYRICHVRRREDPHLSVVIPYMQVDEGKPQVLEDTLKTVEGVDEIIVVVNWKLGYAKPINIGLQAATGEFLLVMNDDMIWDGGSLKRLCDAAAVTSPQVNGKVQPFWGCAFCIPRAVYEKVGGLHEGYRISYFDDADYYNTLAKAAVPTRCVEAVEVHTEGGRTLERFPDRNEFFEENRRHFIERWGKEPEF